MVAGFTTYYAISAYHHHSCEFQSHSWRGVLDTTIYDKVCQWLVTDQRFSPVSSTDKTDHHDITEILLKVMLNTITPNNSPHQPAWVSYNSVQEICRIQPILHI
jgi:hypothetical protein